MVAKAKPKTQKEESHTAAVEAPVFDLPQEGFMGAGFDDFSKLKAERDAARAQFDKKRIEEIRFTAGTDSTEIFFLHETPAVIKYHTVPFQTKKQTILFLKLTCARRNNAEAACACCESTEKDIRKTSLSATFMIMARHILEVTDKGGRKVYNKIPTSEGGTIYVYRATSRASQMLSQLSAKKGLTGRLWDVSRDGEQQDTVYTFVDSDPAPFLEGDLETIAEFSQEAFGVALPGDEAYLSYLADHLAVIPYEKQLDILGARHPSGQVAPQQDAARTQQPY